MPPLVLTPEKAFRAIQEMNHRGKRVSGRAVWQQCGEMGSITTAVKWVKVATAITQGNESVDQDLVDLWEAIAQGKDIPASPPVVHKLPQGLRELFDRFSQQVAIALQQSVTEETRQTQQTAASEIEQAEAETIKSQDHCQELVQEIQKREAIARQQEQTIAELKEKVVSLKARREELERRLSQVEHQKGELEEEFRERSRQVGQLLEKNNGLEQNIQRLQSQNSELNQTIKDLQDRLVVNQQREEAIAEQAQKLKQDNALLEVRFQDSQTLLKHERQERGILDARVMELQKTLVEKSRAVTVLQNK